MCAAIAWAKLPKPPCVVPADDEENAVDGVVEAELPPELLPPQEPQIEREP